MTNKGLREDKRRQDNGAPLGIPVGGDYAEKFVDDRISVIDQSGLKSALQTSQTSDSNVEVTEKQRTPSQETNLPVINVATTDFMADYRRNNLLGKNLFPNRKLRPTANYLDAGGITLPDFAGYGNINAAANPSWTQPAATSVIPFATIGGATDSFYSMDAHLDNGDGFGLWIPPMSAEYCNQWIMDSLVSQNDIRYYVSMIIGYRALGANDNAKLRIGLYTASGGLYNEYVELSSADLLGGELAMGGGVWGNFEIDFPLVPTPDQLDVGFFLFFQAIGGAAAPADDIGFAFAFPQVTMGTQHGLAISGDLYVENIYQWPQLRVNKNLNRYMAHILDKEIIHTFYATGTSGGLGNATVYPKLDGVNLTNLLLTIAPGPGVTSTGIHDPFRAAHVASIEDVLQIEVGAANDILYLGATVKTLALKI